MYYFLIHLIFALYDDQKIITLNSIRLYSLWLHNQDSTLLNLKNKDGDLCLQVVFEKQNLFQINYLAGAPLCPSGKIMMKELLLYARLKKYTKGTLEDTSEFFVDRTKKLYAYSRFLNALQLGYDCGNYAYSYYSQFGFEFDEAENIEIKNSEKYFHSLKLAEFKKQLQLDFNQNYPDATFNQLLGEVTDEAILFIEFLKDLRKKDDSGYAQIMINLERNYRYKVSDNSLNNRSDSMKHWENILFSKKMTIDLGKVPSNNCKKLESF
jgi:hypothetical protein